MDHGDCDDIWSRHHVFEHESLLLRFLHLRSRKGDDACIVFIITQASNNNTSEKKFFSISREVQFTQKISTVRIEMEK